MSPLDIAALAFMITLGTGLTIDLLLRWMCDRNRQQIHRRRLVRYADINGLGVLPDEPTEELEARVNRHLFEGS